MEGDELDPAFAEFDLIGNHAPLSSPSMFASFGGGLENGDREFDQNSFEHNLFSSGHSGRQLSLGIEEEAGVDEGVGDSFDVDNLGHDRYGERRVKSMAEGIDDSLELSDNRMSLAFELASVSESKGRVSNLLAELGLDEEEEEEQGQDEEDDAEAEREFRQGGIGDMRYSLAEKEEENTVHPSHERRTSQTRADHVQVSRARAQPSPQLIAEESLDENDWETAFNEITTSLEESISSIQTLLSQLHDNLHRSVLAADTHDPVPHTTPLESYTDRQPVAEALASSLVKALYSATSVRETQARHITECERLVSRSDANWDAILAELEPISFDDDNEDLPFRNLSNSPYRTSSSPPLSRSIPTANSAGPALSLDTSVAAHPPTEFNVALSPDSATNDSKKVAAELQQLQMVTSIILKTFSSASDIVQVQSALASDAGRKLRALRTQVATIREELVNVDQSEAFVAEFEAKVKLIGRRNYGEEARMIMHGVDLELIRGAGQASRILDTRSL